MDNLNSILSKRGKFRDLDPYFLVTWDYPYKIEPIVFSDNEYSEYTLINRPHAKRLLSEMTNLIVDDFYHTFAHQIPDDYKYELIKDAINFADENNRWTKIYDNDSYIDEIDFSDQNYKLTFPDKKKFKLFVFRKSKDAEKTRNKALELSNCYKYLKKVPIWAMISEVVVHNWMSLDAACGYLATKYKYIKEFLVEPNSSIKSESYTNPKYEIKTRFMVTTTRTGDRYAGDITLRNLDKEKINVKKDFFNPLESQLNESALEKTIAFFEDGDKWGWD